MVAIWSGRLGHCPIIAQPNGHASSKLLRNGRVVGYLAKNYQELLFEFQKLTESEATAA